MLREQHSKKATRESPTRRVAPKEIKK